MIKRVTFRNQALPYLLLLPEIAVTIVFFLWPAGEAVVQSVLLTDPWGQNVQFVWFDNFTALFKSPEYYDSVIVTMLFSAGTTAVAICLGLLFAVFTDRVIRGQGGYKSFLIWPYAVSPVVAGALWLFILHPHYGVLSFALNRGLGLDWNPLSDGKDAMILVIIAAAWPQITYNFIFFLAGLQSIPRSLIEAAAIDGARPFMRFWTIVFPLLSPTSFFLLVVNIVHSFFATFPIIHAVTQDGPGGATNILVYKVYFDGFEGLDLGSSSAQSVVLMFIVVTLTVFQFRYLERRVQYAK